MSKCANSGCLKAGINKCSVCQREPYCGADCQKLDWKSHKFICKHLKKMAHQRQSYQEVLRSIREIRERKYEKKQLNARLLTHLILYTEHQFGDRIPGRDYRERENGERIDNFMVEIGILIPLIKELSSTYTSRSFGMISSGNLRLPLYEKMFDLLRPWSTDLDSESTSRKNSVTIDQSNHILSGLAELENDVALIYMHRGQLNQAETHCKRCLTYSRLFKGTEDEEANLLFEAFYTFSELRQDEGNFADALILAEEAYNCVAVAYNPVHPQVQKAAGNLIECLTLKGDFNKAELFAQMTLDSLKDPGNGFDQQSEAVAFGYLDLAKAISAQKGDYVKAEKLARESLRIRDLISSNSDLVGHTAGLLALMLVSQGKLGSETKELFEQCLAIGIREFGPEGPTIPNKHLHLGSYYRHLAEKEQNTETRKEYLRLSESMIKEALRIHTKLCGLDDPRTFQFLSELSIITHMLSQC